MEGTGVKIGAERQDGGKERRGKTVGGNSV